MKLKNIRYYAIVVIFLSLNTFAMKNSLRQEDPAVILTNNNQTEVTIDKGYNFIKGLDVHNIIKEITEKDFIRLILFYGETHPMILLSTSFIVKATLIYLTQYLDIQVMLNKIWFQLLGMVMYYLLFISALYKLLYPKTIVLMNKFDFDDVKVEQPNMFFNELPGIIKIIGYTIVFYMIQDDNTQALVPTAPSLISLSVKLLTVFFYLNLVLLIGYILYKNTSNEVYQLLSSVIFLLFAVDQTIRYSSQPAIS
jgi:hypothetical protein